MKRNAIIEIEPSVLAAMPGYCYHTWNKVSTGVKGTNSYKEYFPVPMGKDFYSAGLR